MKQFIIIVLILAGFYFLIDHTAPLPLNHEAIGLGTNHATRSLSVAGRGEHPVMTI